MQNVNTNPAARHKPGPSQTPWFGISCYPAPHFFCGDATTPSFLRLSTSQRSLDLLQVQQPGGFKRAARGGRGAGLSDSHGAFFGAAFVRRVDGRFIWVHCSASSASRIHVRAMSIRISRVPNNPFVRCYSPNFRQEILLFKLLNFCVQTIPEVTPLRLAVTSR